MRRFSYAVAVVLVVVSAVPSRSAAEPRAGFHEHDGFYLRLIGGGGYTKFKIGSRSSSAASWDVSAAIGGALTPRIVLYGELFTVLAPSSNMPFNVNGVVRDDTRYGFAGLGPGVSIIAPTNSYASLTLGITQQTLEADLEDDYVFTAKTKTGVGGQLVGGHEWWMSRNWGLGAAVKAYFSTNRGDVFYDEERATTWGVSFGVSATFN